ncbi:MAG: hypothetical protein JST11_30910, partial [Acidobacteria bacterium]|nr:hypothetical protein [Acidobacteriota bacterium]
MLRSRLHVGLPAAGAVLLAVMAWALLAQTRQPDQALLWHYRNLGKAFYENPTTQRQAV